jgi:aspartyl aminopeptidase
MSKRARTEADGSADAEDSLATEMMKFIDASPTPFHMCAEGATMLLAAGFVELAETDAWRPLLKPGGKYFYVRGGCLVAFFVGAAFEAGNGFNIVGAHTDSPVLKLKPCSKKSASGCIQINVETYGGGLWHTWFDRELTLAGAVIVREADGSFSKTLVHLRRPLLRIPNLCIHLTTAEERGKFAPNKETHLQARAREPTPLLPSRHPLAHRSALSRAPHHPRARSRRRHRSQSSGSSTRRSTSRRLPRPRTSAALRARRAAWRRSTRPSCCARSRTSSGARSRPSWTLS